MPANHRLLAFSLSSLFLLALGVNAIRLQPSNQSIPPTTIKLNPNQEYQTIEGFGGYGSQSVWWSDGPFAEDWFIDLLINDLGITILRDSLSLSFEPTNDNDDPYITNWAGFNLTEKMPYAENRVGEHFNYLAKLKRAGLEKVVVSVWSAPPWMKHNQLAGNGTLRENSAPPFQTNPDESSNQLQTKYYEEFAEYCVAYIRLLKQHTGIDLYAISLQNEPRFSQFYMSSVHSPESLAALIKVVGSRLKDEGLNTKIFAPEDVASFEHISRYLQAILEDEQANRLTDIFAIHNYANNGIDPAETSNQHWHKTQQLAKQGGKNLWMSETSGFDGTTMTGGLALARSMYRAMHFGEVTAWIYWQMSGNKNYGLLQDGKPNFLYFVSKHFYRHIRPGMKRIEANSSNPSVLALAFIDKQLQREVVILINTSKEDMAVNILRPHSGSTYTAYLTDAEHQHTKLPRIKQELSIPGGSIITLRSTAAIND